MAETNTSNQDKSLNYYALVEFILTSILTSQYILTTLVFNSSFTKLSFQIAQKGRLKLYTSGLHICWHVPFSSGTQKFRWPGWFIWSLLKDWHICLVSQVLAPFHKSSLYSSIIESSSYLSTQVFQVGFHLPIRFSWFTWPKDLSWVHTARYWFVFPHTTLYECLDLSVMLVWHRLQVSYPNQSQKTVSCNTERIANFCCYWDLNSRPATWGLTTYPPNLSSLFTYCYISSILVAIPASQLEILPI